MKVAVVGSGISGLVAAYELRNEHEVTVFEANDYLGGHTNTVEVELEGEKHAIDTGFIVFNEATYPNFIRLLGELGVASRPTQMSFSVRDERTSLEYSSRSPSTLFAQRRNLLRPRFYVMLADIVRFNREARRLVAGCDDRTTVGEFLARHHYSEPFAQNYLLPMGAAIWSCPIGTFAQFPIRFIVEFFHNHGLLNVVRRPPWRVVAGGSQTYVRALASRMTCRFRLATPVEQVSRFANHVAVQSRRCGTERFDRVIFACHSDQALRMLAADATPAERQVLEALPYQRNAAVLHTDTAVLPRTRRAWASWNYRIRAGAWDTVPASVSYNMNMLQGIESRHTFCVTLGDSWRIAPQKVLRRFEYDHPVFTARRAAAQARHGELLGANRTSFCGAYWGNGFHEDGVNSALAVVDELRRTAQVGPHALAVAGRAAA